MSLSRNQRRSLETLSLLERHYGHRVDAFVARGTCDYKTCVRHDLVYFVSTEGTPGVLLVQLPGLDVESAAMESPRIFEGNLEQSLVACEWTATLRTVPG